MPFISVVVPVHDRENILGSCLEAVKRSDYRDYEIIVADCGSRDTTRSIARKYTDMVIELNRDDGIGRARSSGAAAAGGEIIVNIDSDVLIKPDTLARIADFFRKNKDTDAVTGLLSKEHPNMNFFSQYKNLYMRYIFSRLPERITFLYGSIYAVRRKSLPLRSSYENVADDTALGQELVASGKRIAFLRDLEVVHLKKYNIYSFIKNDFDVPFTWIRIFLKHKGWEQLGKTGTGYAHSPVWQIVSIIFAPAIVLAILASILFGFFIRSAVLLVLIWSVLNIGFLMYLTRERGIIFGIAAIFVTFLDNIVMALGVFFGLVIPKTKGYGHAAK